MNEKSKYLFKNIGILTISNFASKILVFLLVPLYTSVLSTSEYGTYDLIISTISLLYPILTLNILDAVMRFFMDHKTDKTDIVNIGFRIVILSIIFVCFFCIIINYSNCFKSLKGLEFLIFLYYSSYVFNQFFVQMAKGLEMVKQMGIAGVISTIIMLLGNILFLLVFKMGLKGFFIANILSQIIPSLYYFVILKFWKYISLKKIDNILAKEMLIFCLPLLFTALGWWVNNVSDRYIVTLICGVAANGLLSVAYKIPSIINTIQGIFVQAWQISAIKEYNAGNTKEFYNKTYVVINSIMIIVSSFLMILSRFLAHILYAKDFFDAWQYVHFLIISTSINCASGFIGPILVAKKDSTTMALSSIIGSIVNIILNFVLIYFFGIQGATIATVISSYTIYHIRFIAVKDEICKVNYCKVLLGWIILTIQAFVDIFTGMWIIQIFIVVFLVVLNFKPIISIITGVKKNIL